jgi:hypothetical protein
MDKRKLNKSKITGNVLPGDDNPMMSVIVHVREPAYVPAWLSLRKKITEYIFTAAIMKTDLSKLEADKQVTSVSINEQLDSI